MKPKGSLPSSLLLCLFFFSSLATSTTGISCYSVTFTSFTYSEPEDLTTFYYSTSIVNGSDCQGLSQFDLEVFCPVVSSSPSGSHQINDPSTGLTGWKFDHDQDAGTTEDYQLRISGMVTSLATGSWAIKAGLQVFFGNTSSPFCPDPTSTPMATTTATTATAIVTATTATSPTLASTNDCPAPTSTVTVTVTACATASPSPTNEPTQPQGFDCEIITVTELFLTGTNSSNTTFQVSLGSAPPSDVTIIVTSSCVSLSLSSLTFTNLTWNIPQTVTVYNNLLGQTAANCTIELAASGFSDCLSTIAVYKSPPPSGGGDTWGDPHYLTFDGIRYNSLSKGDFYFVRQFSSELVIQLRQDQCGKATCNYAIAVRFRSCVFYSYFNSFGLPQVSLVGDARANGMVIGSLDGKYSLYFLSAQILVEITPGISPSGRFYFLSASVFLGLGFQKGVGGTAGYFDGFRENDFLMLSGSLTQDPEEFVDSWRILAYEDLFVNPRALIPPIFGATPYDGPLPIDVDASTFVAPGDITADLQANAGTESPLKNQSIPSSGPIASCDLSSSEPLYLAGEAACTRYFPADISDCCDSLGIPASQFISSCICDYVLSAGLMDFAYESIGAYLQRCESVASLFSTKCFSCPRACSGHGICDASICQCDPGFYGADCSEDWSLAPQLTAITPSSAKLGCDQPLTLSGRHFYGSSQCDFGGGFVSPAVSISSFQLSCLIPTTLPFGSTSASVRVLRSDGRASSSLSLALTPSCCVSPCQNGGTCKLASKVVTCSCPPNLSGQFCEIVADACTSNPCLRGSCSSSLGSFSCNCTGTGYYGTSCNHRGVCRALTDDDHARWPQALSLTTSYGTCLPGYLGKPSRPCQAEGTFGPIISPCLINTTTCLPETFSNAQWPETLIGQGALGTCLPGFTGTPSRSCLITGSWATNALNLCKRNVCLQEPDEQGNLWPATNSLITRKIACAVGKGFLYRLCQAEGTWASLITGTCS